MEMIYRIKQDIELNGEEAEIFRNFRSLSCSISKQADVRSSERLAEIESRLCEIQRKLELLRAENDGQLSAIIDDLHQQTTELDQEKNALLRTMESRNANRKGFGLFIRQLQCLPTAAPDGTKININTVTVNYENTSKGAAIDPREHSLAAAPDYLSFDKHFYHTFIHDCGVSIYFEKENIDTTEAVSSFVLTALAALAQEESLSISENLKWANEKRFPAGEVPNLVIYGYRYCKGKNEYSITESGYKMKNIEIVPEQAEVVRHIFNEVARGKKYVDIARELNARHIPPPERRKGGRNGLWSGRDIGNIIKSERYVGDVLIQKTVTVDALSHKTVSNSGEAPQYLIHDHHPAIIDRILYNAVQAVRQKNAEVHGNNRGSTRKDQILTGLVKCGCCGKNYNVRGRNRIPTWFCPDAEVYKGITPCQGQSVTERTIIGFIKKAFFQRFGDYNFIKLLTKTLKEVQSEAALERNTNDLEIKIAVAEKRITSLESKIAGTDKNSKLYQILCGELSYQKDNHTKAKNELERIQQLQTTVSKHYDLRNELIEVLENQENVLPLLFGRFLKAIIISITIKSSEHYIIRWLDGTVTEIGG